MTLRNALDKPIIEQRRRSGTRAAGARVPLGATALADLLAPDGVDRRRNHLVLVGDSCITTLELRGFPHTLDLAWLSDPALGLDAPGVTIHQRIVPVPDASRVACWPGARMPRSAPWPATCRPEPTWMWMPSKGWRRQRRCVAIWQPVQIGCSSTRSRSPSQHQIARSWRRASTQYVWRPH